MWLRSHHDLTYPYQLPSRVSQNLKLVFATLVSEPFYILCWQALRLVLTLLGKYAIFNHSLLTWEKNECLGIKFRIRILIVYRNRYKTLLQNTLDTNNSKYNTKYSFFSLYLTQAWTQAYSWFLFYNHVVLIWMMNVLYSIISNNFNIFLVSSAQGLNDFH